MTSTATTTADSLAAARERADAAHAAAQAAHRAATKARKARQPKRAAGRSARYGTGSIYYDESRRLWVGQVDMPPAPDGRRRPKRVTARERDDMLDKLAKLQAQVRAGEVVATKGWTVASWCDHWLAHIAPKPSRAGYAKTLRLWVLPHVGKRTLVGHGQLQPRHVYTMLAALESAGLSEGVRCLARRTLSSALTAAERDPSIGLRWNAAKVTKAPAASRKHDAMLPAQAAAILAFARLDRLYALAVLALTTGLRQAECLALRWEDVNLRAGTLQVVHAKTRAGVREVPLSPQLVDALKAHQAAQRAERMAATEWFDTGLVFTTTAGTALTASIATKWWHRQTRGAGLGTRRFHAARHTAATMMLNHGADLATVSRILGHSSIAVTADIYARPDARKLRAGADAVAAALAGAA